MASDCTFGTSLGGRIREARRAHAWSQSQLAEQADVSRPTIARIEAGQRVRMGTLETVAEVLGLTLELGHSTVQVFDELTPALSAGDLLVSLQEPGGTVTRQQSATPPSP